MTDESIWENILPQLRQIGGSHYKEFKIQPYEFIAKNNLSFQLSGIEQSVEGILSSTGNIVKLGVHVLRIHDCR